MKNLAKIAFYLSLFFFVISIFATAWMSMFATALYLLILSLVLENIKE